VSSTICRFPLIGIEISQKEISKIIHSLSAYLIAFFVFPWGNIVLQSHVNPVFRAINELMLLRRAIVHKRG